MVIYNNSSRHKEMLMSLMPNGKLKAGCKIVYILYVLIMFTITKCLKKKKKKRNIRITPKC